MGIKNGVPLEFIFYFAPTSEINSYMLAEENTLCIFPVISRAATATSNAQNDSLPEIISIFTYIIK